MTSFDDFGLADPIRRALAEENYTIPTPIQAQTIPIAITGRDVVGIAQTGTGKTAAFALPILHRIAANRLPLQKKSCRTLILSPTRELSAQILDSIQAYGRHLHISATLAIGGVSMGTQVRALMNGVDVLVATPGRLLDLVQSNALRLGQVDCLVLDEADRMLDMGFINDIRKIVSKLPKERQTLFFSATMPQAIAELASLMLRDPARVAVTPVASTAERVEQRVIHVDRGGKPNLLVQLLKEEPVERVLVFTRTKHGADKVVRNLVKFGIPAEAIHGNKSQNQRNRALDNFRSGSVRTLVATDIAARGIDVDGVSHVFNFDLPNIPDSYVHRIGRTARAGAEGIAISFCDADEVAFLRDIERLIRQKIPATDKRTQQTALPEAGAPQPHRQQKSGGGGRGGRNNQPRRSSTRPAYGRDGGGRDGGQGRDQNQGRSQENRSDSRGDNRGAPQNRPAPAAVTPHRAEPSRQARPEGRPDNQARPNRHNPQGAPRRNGGEDRFTGRAESLSGVAFMQRTGQKRRNNNRPQRPTN